ncbi:pyridoxal phosphate-dependent transferase [Chaetomium fimeti]|uniref:Pyridoxal phosphate-dependent transferase n=1 Tax=Chaetomium fimeti TaxID=1854472 RepID=A0AAE0LT37_9PEZI|nr:pyridoxal phosphate-dependent transferase [Chaetomium fimeti]
MGQFLSTSSKSTSRILPRKTEHDITESCSDLGHPQTPLDGLPVLKKAKGHYWYPVKGPKILDACGGAGVACLGHGCRDIIKAVTAQMESYTYASYAHFQTTPVQELSDWLIKSTGGQMQKVYVMCSGSEAIEAALKLSVEYFRWKGEPERVNFIARHDSYHGTTLGSLSVSGHHTRRAPFHPLLSPSHFHHIPACNPYREEEGQYQPQHPSNNNTTTPSPTTTPSSSSPPSAASAAAAYLSHKTAQLEAAFARLGPHTVAAVVLEPVVGAALGCMPAPAGYLAAMKAVCARHGALLVLDEVMCGMGRVGSTHAWQGETNEVGEGVGVVPDLQAVAKGFAGGYAPASALLVGARVAGLMEREGRVFTHGHTYQNHPVVAAAALAVQRAVEREGLLENVRVQGALLGRLLRERLRMHPNVGDVRGRGLFWGVEFVKDRGTKEPFEPGLGVAEKVHKTAVREFRVLVYHGQGCAGGGRGDHIMIMPAYNISAKLVAEIVERVAGAIEEVFRRL